MASEIKVNKITGKGATGGADAPLQFDGNVLTTATIANATITNATITDATIATGTATLSKLNLSNTTPSSPVEGDMYFDSTNKLLKIYVNSEWQSVYGVGNFTNPGLGSYAVDNYTKLLIHSDTSNGSTSFIDSSASGHIITANGGTVHSTAQKKFGTSSIDFDGNNELNVTAHSDFTFGTDDFTIDMWFYVDTASYEKPILTKGYYQSGVNGGFQFRIDEWAGGTITFSVTNGTTTSGRYQSAASAFVDNQWNHIAAVRRYGIDFKLYINGVDVPNISGEVPITSTNFSVNSRDLMVGHETAYQSGNSAHMWGYLDEVRVSKGIARWTSNFTV